VLTDHFINPVLPSMNEKKWQSLGPELQEKVLQALEVARDVCDSTNLKAEAELVEFFKGEGMTILTPDKAAFTERAKKMYLENTEISGSWDMELFEKVQTLAE